MSRILAQAVVDPMLSPLDPTKARWLVTVDGRREEENVLNTRRRIYRLTASSDTLAAQEGIRLFVDEMTNLASERNGNSA